MEKEVTNSLDWKEIGQRFKFLRKSRDLSQEKISELSSQQRGNIPQFENGVAPASTNYALFLRNEFGASFDWLYDGAVIDRAYADVQTKKIIDPHAIGARLKAIRKEKGMTQVEFGRVLGIPGATLSNFEKGERVPRIETALKIKRALNKPLDWIYFGDEPIVPQSVRRARANQIKSNQLSQESKKKSRL